MQRSSESAQPANVSVVLCTYNGTNYLTPLLDSIAEQSTAVDRIVLRDDGSSDNSVSLVRDWTKGRGITLVEVREPAARLGPAKSFLTAIALGGPAKFHFLADQDDVWLPGKVERAVAALTRAPPGPALYASRVHIVDAVLKPIGHSQLPGCLSFSSAAFESLLTGCTMAFNEDLRRLVARQVPHAVQMHDWWLYMLASATGHIAFDAEPTLLYRQHGQNMIGAGPRGVAALATRLRRVLRGPVGVRRAQLREFGCIYADVLPASARSLVDALSGNDATWWARWGVACTVPITRRTWLDRAGTRLSIMRNRF